MRVAIDAGRIRLADALLVYLERTQAQAEPLPPGTLPTVYGTAALAPAGPGEVIAPVAVGEAIWLGLQPVDRTLPVTLRVRVDRPYPLDAITGEPWDDVQLDAPRNYLTCPPDYSLPGVREPAGYVPFGQRQPVDDDLVEQLTVVACGVGSATIRLVTPEAFERATGRTFKPLDPNAAYRGWRLP